MLTELPQSGRAALCCVKAIQTLDSIHDLGMIRAKIALKKALRAGITEDEILESLRAGKIIITFDRVMHRGDKMIKLVSFKGIKDENVLPRRYIDQRGPTVCITSQTGAYCKYDLLLKLANQKREASEPYLMAHYGTDEILSAEDFEALLRHIKQAAEGLAKISQEIAEESAAWLATGLEVII